MLIQIGICDDNKEDIKVLSESLNLYGNSFKIIQYADGESLIEDCLQHKIIFDILFLDIYMPGLNGIETARKIRSCMKEVKIIFLSSSKEHYPESYDVFAFNYLIKPLNPEKLNRVLDQALMSINPENRQQIYFKYKGINCRIFCNDINYIESSDKIIIFHMADNTSLKCYDKLDEILKRLPESFFIRCHQSYAINVLHVDEMAEQHFRIGQALISISKKYQKSAKDKYFGYLFTHMNNRV